MTSVDDRKLNNESKDTWKLSWNMIEEQTSYEREGGGLGHETGDMRTEN